MERYDSGMSSGTPLPGSDTRILVNGDPEQVPPGCTVEQLLAQLDLAGKRVAVAVDRSVVPRSSWPGFALQEGAHVEILEAVGGG